MSMPVNSNTFNEMVDEDLKWLEEKGIDLQDVCYGLHISACMEMAKKYYKEVYLPSLPDSAWNC